MESHVREAVEEVLETVEIGEEEILTEIVETVKEDFLKGMIRGPTKKSQSRIIFEKPGEKGRAMPIITLLNQSSLENLKEIEMIK